jgi:hypothetical protein
MAGPRGLLHAAEDIPRPALRAMPEEQGAVYWKAAAKLLDKHTSTTTTRIWSMERFTLDPL